MMTQLMLLEEAHRWQSRKGGQGGPYYPQTKIDIGDFTVPIFCPQTTQEQPKKHSEAGPPEHLLVSL